MNLDFSELVFKKNNSLDFVLNKSEEIARQIFTSYRIKSIYNTYHDITSLEFYIFKKGIFEDFNTHGSNMLKNHPQLTNGRFYVHMHPRIKYYNPETSGFKNVNRFGLDITCGNKDLEIFGGILIKGIDSEFKSSSSEIIKLISKPDNTLNHWSDKEKQKLREINLSDIFTGPIQLTKSGNRIFELKYRKRNNLVKESYKNAPLRYDCFY